MKHVSALVFPVLICSGYTMASELPRTFAEAEALAIKQQEKTAQYYERYFRPFFFERVMSRCIQQYRQEKRPVAMVLAFNEAGMLMRAYRATETPLSTCLENEALKVAVPKPPISPFFYNFEVQPKS